MKPKHLTAVIAGAFALPLFFGIMPTVGVSAMASSMVGMLAMVSTDSTERNASNISSDPCENVAINASIETKPTKTVEEFADAYGQWAYEVGKKYGLPYEGMLAQAAVESGYGSSTPGNNFFGIKKWKDGQPTVSTGTQEEVGGAMISTTADWVAYDSPRDSFEGYGEFITQNSNYRASGALDHRRDPQGYLEAIKAAGYATASNYVESTWSVAQQFINYFASTNKLPSSAEMEFDATPTQQNDSDGSSGSDESDDTTTVSCTTENTSDAEYGEVGGAPTDRHDFGWMCDEMGVCKNGDGLDGEGDTSKVFYHANVGRYQCVWYAWNRLAMIHGRGFTFLLGNGGDIAERAATTSGWTVSDTPKPGDGISAKGGGLGGDLIYGHIAVVEKVKKIDSGGWKIMISEGNYGTGGSGAWTGYNTRWIDGNTLSGNIFFRYDGWKD